MSDPRIDALIDRLEQLVEDLSEFAIDELRDALRSGAGKRPEREKRLTQARRAVEKAAHVLRGLDADPGDSGDPFVD